MPERSKKRRKVFIPLKSVHNFSPALRYGDLVFLSEEPIAKYDIAEMSRRFYEVLNSSAPTDYLLPSSMPIMSLVAAGFLATKHGGKLNLLLYRNGKYVERLIDFNNLIEELEDGQTRFDK